MTLDLKNVTLVCADCLDPQRAGNAFRRSMEEINFASVKLLTDVAPNVGMPKGVEIVKIGKIKSKVEYSAFVLKEMHRYIDTPFAMTIQFDGYVLKPSAWSDDFLKYDYIGAPWLLPKYANRVNIVGNGGFSIRSKRLMEATKGDTVDMKKCNGNEDYYLCCMRYGSLLDAGYTFAPVNVARRFSVEGMKWDGQFGFHNPMITDIAGAFAS